MVKVARIISYVFHPIFAPLVVMFFLFNLPVYYNYKLTDSFFLFVYGVILLNLIIAPTLSSLHLKRKGVIDSLLMADTKQRVLPFLITSLFYMLTYFLFDKINLPALYLSIFKVACLVIFLLFVLATIGYKISAHLSALGGICGVLIVARIVLKVDTTPLLIVCLLLSGIVASSRLTLGAHTLSELAAGFGLGIGMQILICL